MTDADALLREILNSPGDDSLRLIYADCIEEQGQRERAEFIRVQIEIAQQRAGVFKASPENDQRQDWLEKREHQLWNMGTSGNWVIPDPVKFPGGAHICLPTESMARAEPQPHLLPIMVCRRGFFESFTGTWDDWLTHAAAILAAQPVERVTLTTMLESGEGFWAISANKNRWANDRWPRITFSLPSGAAVPG